MNAICPSRVARGFLGALSRSLLALRRVLLDLWLEERDRRDRRAEGNREERVRRKREAFDMTKTKR